MPHAILEYSNNIAPAVQAGEALRLVHGAMTDSGLFKAHDIKTRAHPVHDFLVGEKGASGSFLHATVYLLEGRTTEQKQALSQTIFDKLSLAVKQADSVTVDIRELVKETYRKSIA